MSAATCCSAIALYPAALIGPSPALPTLALTPAGIAANDGGWIALSWPSGCYQHTAIYDTVRDRTVAA